MNFHGGIATESYLDFSVNVPALSPDARERAVLAAALDELHRYPSIDNSALSLSLETLLGLPAIVSGGATQAIYAVGRLQRGKKVLLIEPTFTEYERAMKESILFHFDLLAACREEDAQERGAVSVRQSGDSPRKDTGKDSVSASADGVSRLRTADNLSFEDRLACLIVEEIQKNGVETVVLCNPNNPFGYVLPNLAETLLTQTGVFVVVDESFIDFVDGIDLKNHFLSVRESVHRSEGRLLVIRSLTKAFSVPGLRLGYVCGTEAAMDELLSEIPPWSVNSIAAAYMEYLLQSRRLLDSGVSGYRSERERMMKFFDESGYSVMGYRDSGANSCFVFPESKVNFFVFRAKKGLNDRLRSMGMNLRTCSDFRGLGDTFYRTTVRSAPDNDRLLGALEEVSNDFRYEDRTVVSPVGE